MRSAVKTDPVVKSWLKNTDLERDIGLNNRSRRNSMNNGENHENDENGDFERVEFIEYLPLVDRMVRIFVILLENSNGIIVGGNNGNQGNENNLIDYSNLTWILREFEFLDLLISQVHIKYWK